MVSHLDNMYVERILVAHLGDSRQTEETETQSLEREWREEASPRMLEKLLLGDREAHERAEDLGGFEVGGEEDCKHSLLAHSIRTMERSLPLKMRWEGWCGDMMRMEAGSWPADEPQCGPT